MRAEGSSGTPSEPLVVGIHSVLIFTAKPIDNAHWWANMLGGLPVYRLPLFASIKVGGTEVSFRPTDYRNPPGGSPTLYWRVERFNDARYHFKDWSCIELHYPVLCPDGTQVTQFRDPFGVIFGIQGPASSQDPVWPDRDLHGGTILAK